LNLNQPFKLSQDGHNYIKLLKDPNSVEEKSNDEYEKSKAAYEKSIADYEQQPIESTAYQMQGNVKAAVNAWLKPKTNGVNNK
jgi:hypothetical protein